MASAPPHSASVAPPVSAGCRRCVPMPSARGRIVGHRQAWGDAPPPPAAEEQATWAVHVTLAPTWFDPAETAGIITPFMVLYALHDALVKPMPGNPMAPSLAESWNASPDGLVYEFVLRKGVKFHNGEPVTAEDVKFSFERYRGTAAGSLKARVAAGGGRSMPSASASALKQPWPDFMTLLRDAGHRRRPGSCRRSTSSRSGDDGFKKAPGRRRARTGSCRSSPASS